ncbi:unnamed protein product [Bursaphelenchus okinawaensis]|uniref:Uncharacterized protein n=1 Tax=Bursaphelenchus okinawaensis TaxID=465554 RepID=A0A811LBT2_9BILA|nr:unnamed protein product [Bursaphelenchus okinawaensis]CAG9120032.1 unnamed protein product [Bursaphelenchus okinawaensis]
MCWLLRIVCSLIVLLITISLTQSSPVDRGNLKKASDNPQWEDLGWAWGKRSVAVELVDPEDVMLQRYVRSLKAIKKNPDWHDLGWAWGK